jgi:hypothetical protein
LGAAAFVALIDTVSTHSFIGEEATHRSGLTIEPRPCLTTTVANGERVSCPGVILQSPIVINSMQFHVDLFVMPLAGFDVVLGTHWMATLGPITWDLAARTISFQQDGRTICWQGVPTAPRPQETVAVAAKSLLGNLLAVFSDLFGEPTSLPPARGHNHRIMLQPGTSPVAVRPYRYPATHKDELERQCAAMIEHGIVRCSDSPFSSPVLLIRKPDGSWRFCVDYHALNVITIKDAFPIPMVDELLDELHGTRFFTKHDLRSGYHQVWMQA